MANLAVAPQIGQLSSSTLLRQLGWRLAMAGMGHEEQFPATRPSARCGFRKETIAALRHNPRGAPISVVRVSEEDFVGFSHVFRPGRSQAANRMRHWMR
jgi:hypothetical protein